MKTITRTRTIEEVTGYEATDGTLFESIEECKKYESTCKGVIMGAYRQLVVAEISEYDLFDTGYDENGWDIVKIESSNDLEIVNKALLLGYNSVTLLGFEHIGKEIMVEHDCENVLTGYWTTFDIIMNNIEKSYRNLIDNSLKKYEQE